MPDKATRKPVVESKPTAPRVGMGEGLSKMFKDTASTLKDVYTEALTKDGGGRWGDHAVTDNLIPDAIRGRALDEKKRRNVQSYIGGYDFVSKFPESGTGAKVLAGAHQARDIVTKGAAAFLGRGLKGLLETARKETEGYEGNVRGIEAAQRDFKAGTLKQAEEFGHPSQELIEQAIKDTDKPKGSKLEQRVKKAMNETDVKQSIDKQKMSEMAMNLLPIGGAIGTIKSSVDDVARVMERASWSAAQKEKWAGMGDDPLSFMEYQLASSQRSAAKFPEAKPIVKRWEEEIKEFKLVNKIKEE